VVTATNSVGAAYSTSSATTVVQSAASAPSNTAPPTISGTPQQGQVLNANPGTWSGTQPITYGYRWMSCDSTGANCAPISGAATASYPVASADIGHTLLVVVTATNSVSSVSAPSKPTAVVQAGSSGGTVVALWHMDETSGSTMFDSIAANNGTLFHVTTGQPGFLNLAYGFNGTSSYVSVPSAPALNPGGANVTMTIHLQTSGMPPAPPADWDVFRKGLYVTPGGELKMEFQQSGQASCGFEGSGGYSELIAGPKINNGLWHTVQCVKTASAIKVVVDGVSYTESANLGSISNTSPVVIGARPGSDWYRGALDEASLQVG
jgi:Concanavalin A-like lectin/glucanases superfamily